MSKVKKVITVDELKNEFKEYVTESNKNILAMGKLLIQIIDELDKQGDKTYTDWLKDEVCFSHSLANKYVKIAKEYTDAHSELVTSLGVKKAYVLLNIKKLDDRVAFINKHELCDKTYSQIVEVLKANGHIKDKKQESITAISIIKDIDKFKTRFKTSLEGHIEHLDSNSKLLNDEHKETLNIYKDFLCKLEPVKEELAKGNA